MAESVLALNKPPILVIDVGACENWKRFKLQKYEVYIVATEIIEKAKKVQAAVLNNLMGHA